MRSTERTYIFTVAGAILVCFCAVGGFFLTTPSEILSLSESIFSPAWYAITPVVSSPPTVLPLRFNSLLQLHWEAATGVSLSVLTAIPEARIRVEEEHKRTVDEQDAFERFRRHVAALETPQTPTGGSHKLREASPFSKTTSPSSIAGSLGTIQQMYRDTVMGVPHYEEEYGEPLEQNLALEFGEELAVALTTNARLTRYLQQSIVQAADEAATRRARFISRLQTEIDALEDADRTLSKIQTEYEALTGQIDSNQSVDELRETHRRLERCRTNCEDVLGERQTHRVDGHMTQPHTSELVDLHEYLYQPLDGTYPVLSDATTMFGQIETACNRAEESLTRRL